MSSTLPPSASATPSVDRALQHRASALAGRAEELVAALALLVMTLLPLAEILVRRLFTSGIPGAGSIVQHLTLWVGFVGAALAARDNRLIALASGALLPDAVRRVTAIFAGAVAAAVTAMLFWGSVQLILTQRELGQSMAFGIPVWTVQLVLPVALAAIAVRLVRHAAAGTGARALAAAGLAVGVLVVWQPAVLVGPGLTIALVLLICGGVLGTPIYAVLGGAALLLFLADGLSPVAVLIETYSLAVSPTLPAIPLFTLAGFILAHGRASHRLMRLFRAWVGWMPGGTAVVVAVLCSFFTVLTGGSGVTILALGGLLFPALLREGYRDRFALGLMTASGSLGLLLPPALPLIVYAVIAMVPVEELFAGGALPGLLLTTMIAAWGIREGVVGQTPRTPFRVGEALAAFREAKWEALAPVVIVVSIFSGWATPIESAAVTAFYVLITQGVIHQEIGLKGDLRRVTCDCAAVVGGVLIILGVAVGLTSYMVTADVPGQLLRWTQQHIESRAMFLLALNGLLLVVGCLMDIFSAMIVVVPLIAPLGVAFGVDPVHLGIIFVANLELGYLTPPVGLNLFLASYRFERPVFEVFRAAVAPLIILGAGVLLITYVPWLTTWLLPGR